MPINLQYVVFALLGLVAVFMISKMIKNGGFTGAMFGAPVREMVSEVELQPRGMMKTRLKIYALDPRDPADGPHVGVEVIHSTVGSWNMTPISLTMAEAQSLAEQLMHAAKEH